MAIVVGQQQDNNNTNLNSGMSSSGTGAPQAPGMPQQGPGVGGAVTSTGQQATGQGGAGGAGAAGSNAPKTPSSGQYTNFSNFTANNQAAGQRITNALDTSFQQQGQQEQSGLKNTNQVAQGVQAANAQVTQGLNQVNQSLQTGDFSSFLNGISTAPTQGVAAPATAATPGGVTTPAALAANTGAVVAPGTAQAPAPSSTTTALANPAQSPAIDPNNPIYQGLATWAQNLATGTTNQGQLQNQANQYFNTAQNQVQGMQTNQKLLGQQGGVGQLLSGILGGAGNYGRGAQNLDQALITGNSGNYSNVLGTAANQVTGAQNALTGTQNTINAGITGLGVNAQNVSQQLKGTAGQPGLLGQGLNTLDASLASTAATNEAQRQAQQLDILNQFNTQTFRQGTADQLGIGGGATLFNILHGGGQNYGATTAADLANFNNTPYLSLNQEVVNNADVINQRQTQQYAALQKMLGNTDTTQYAYKQAAGPLAAADTINAQAFDTNLANLYNQSANAAATGQIGGHGQQDYSSGLFGTNHGTAVANVAENIGSLINVGQLQQGAQALNARAAALGAAGNPSGAVLGAMSAPGSQTAGQTAGSTPNLWEGLQTGASQIPNAIASGAAGFMAGGGPQSMLAMPLAIAAALPSALSAVSNMGNAVLSNASEALGGAFGMNGTESSSQADANAQAMANMQYNWKNYLQSQGYNDKASVIPDVVPMAANNLPVGVSNLLNG